MTFCKPSSFNANGHLTSMATFPQQDQDTKISGDAANQGSFCYNIKPDSWISNSVCKLTNGFMQRESPIKSWSLNVLKYANKASCSLSWPHESEDTLIWFVLM